MRLGLDHGYESNRQAMHRSPARSGKLPARSRADQKLGRRGQSKPAWAVGPS